MTHDYQDQIRRAEDEISPTESAVTDQDLSTDDLFNNGALPEDLQHGNMGRREYEADLMDPTHEDTIDDRIRQEVPEEGSDVVPDQLREREPEAGA